LLERLTVHFEPGKYHNEHLKKVMAMIEKKARGEKFTLFKPRPRKPTGPDRLLEALEARLKKAA